MNQSIYSMSLQRYLFILIALFVVLLAGLQLFMISYVQEQMASEVESKSRTLSEQAVDLLVKTLPLQPDEPIVWENNSSVEINIIKTPAEVVDLGDGYQFVTGDQSQTVTVQRVSAAHTGMVRQQLRRRLDQMEFGTFSNNYAFSVGFNNDDEIHQQVVQFNEQGSAVDQYLDYLIWLTIGICSAGLLFAYWLANHISRPLADLSSGFLDLERGELGKQIEASGVQEVKATLERFNHMSSRLEKLNQMEKRFQQQHQLAELGDISRGLAHTLRNPINTIGLAIEQISQPDLTEHQRIDLAHQARQKINHIDNTIKALLSLTATGVDRNQSVRLNTVIQDIIMELSMAGSPPIIYTPSQDIQLIGSDIEIRSMLHTLLVNACDASGANDQVSVFAERTAQNVVVRVIDQGPGLSKTIQENLFKPHVSSKSEGAGMGLYITKRIAQSHYQGDVTLQNTPAGGCMATLTLGSPESGNIQ